MTLKPSSPDQPALPAKPKLGELISRNGIRGFNPVNPPSRPAGGIQAMLDRLEAVPLDAAPSDMPATRPTSTRTGGLRVKPSLPDQRVSDDLIQFLAQQRSK